MAPCKLLAALGEAGLNDNKLNLIQYELDMDADADDNEENEEHEEAEQLGTRDSEDVNFACDLQQWDSLLRKSEQIKL